MATFDEAFKASVEYFDGDELAANVFVTKYALTTPAGDVLEKTPREMHRRLAREFARIEKKYPNPMGEEEIFGLLDGFEYLVPQGSPMAGIGNPYQTMSLGNCFVIETGDSYGWICKADQELAQLCKRRAGVGVDISAIRPRGMHTDNAAKTTDGIAVFMERFSRTIREVGQGGRRGASLQSISVHHPEIRTFINIKRDLTKVTGSNISIRLSDEFMKAVKEGTDVELRWPVDSKEPKVRELVDARTIWGEIIDSAHAVAEPGLLFWDTIKRESPADIYPRFQTISTNPCIPAWSVLVTPQGMRQLKDIVVGDTIWSGQRWTKVTDKFMTGIKPVYAYRTHAGTFYGTEDHRVVSEGTKVQIKDADCIDISVVGGVPGDVPLDCADVVDGLVLGDGSYHKASDLVVLYVGKDDSCYFGSEISSFLGPVWDQERGAYKIESTFDFLPMTYDRTVPDKFFYGNSSKVRGFLRGLYSANGSIVSRRVTLKTSSSCLRDQVQQMLASVGIASYYTTNKSHDVEFANGTYTCRESYDVNIGTHAGRCKFQELIGFIHPEKQERLRAVCVPPKTNKPPKTSYEVVSTELLGEEPVFDITVEADEHTFFAGGLLVSNCGEIVLSAYCSCRLLLVNMYSYVVNPFSKTAYFDFEKFRDHAIKAQRLMDDLADLELEAVDRILAKIDCDPEPEDVKQTERGLWLKVKDSCARGRRTGLGPTAVGDTLAALNIRYGSEESIDMVGRLYGALASASHESSCRMAGERGPFPDFDRALEEGHPFLDRIWALNPEAKRLYDLHGRRNIANLTTAPAGSTSLLTQTTSGIECVFLVEHTRNKKVMDGSKPDFVDPMGDGWKRYKVEHPKFKVWKEVTGLTDQKDSPYWGATSADLDWKAGVRLQAAAQRFVDHAISRTQNLPADASKELVGQLYMAAWEAGCKGFTVYRDGCRTGVLVANDVSPKEEQPKPTLMGASQAPKRPEVLDCDIHWVNVRGQPYTVLVGLLNGKPYEIFGGHPLKDLDKSHETGKIKKISHGKKTPATYNLHTKNGHEEKIEDIAQAFDNPSWGAFTRLLSVALRHGTPVQYVAEQIARGGDPDMRSFSKVMARVLKRYIPQGAKAASDKVCGACGQEGLVYQEGCLRCTACGTSRCS